jgi:hypothetical protein
MPPRSSSQLFQSELYRSDFFSTRPTPFVIAGPIVKHHQGSAQRRHCGAVARTSRPLGPLEAPWRRLCSGWVTRLRWRHVSAPAPHSWQAQKTQAGIAGHANPPWPGGGRCGAFACCVQPLVTWLYFTRNDLWLYDLYALATLASGIDLSVILALPLRWNGEITRYGIHVLAIP